MAKNIKTLNYDFKYKGKNINGEMKIDLERFEGQYTKAQFGLDSMVMTAMIPYMPMQTGTFINVTRGMSAAIAGSGKVYAAAPPFGRFLYEGEVMVGERTRSAWAAKGERKVATERPLQYSRHAHPKVSDHWFDTAKKYHGKAWVKKVKSTAGGG
jgi:hypothetical protein